MRILLDSKKFATVVVPLLSPYVHTLKKVSRFVAVEVADEDSREFTRVLAEVGLDYFFCVADGSIKTIHRVEPRIGGDNEDLSTETITQLVGKHILSGSYKDYITYETINAVFTKN